MALGVYLRRQRSRLGAPKAITAAAHKLARIVYNLVRFGAAYVQQTEEQYGEQYGSAWRGSCAAGPGSWATR